MDKDSLSSREVVPAQSNRTSITSAHKIDRTPVSYATRAGTIPEQLWLEERAVPDRLPVGVNHADMEQHRSGRG
jgi:hypothetical protein